MAGRVSMLLNYIWNTKMLLKNLKEKKGKKQGLTGEERKQRWVSYEVLNLFYPYSNKNI